MPFVSGTFVLVGEGQMFQPAGEGESRFAFGSKASTVESLDDLMAAQAEQPMVDAMMPSQMLGKLLRRFGSAVR